MSGNKRNVNVYLIFVLSVIAVFTSDYAYSDTLSEILDRFEDERSRSGIPYALSQIDLLSDQCQALEKDLSFRLKSNDPGDRYVATQSIGVIGACGMYMLPNLLTALAIESGIYTHPGEGIDYDVKDEMMKTVLKLSGFNENSTKQDDPTYSWKHSCDKNFKTMAACASEMFSFYDKILNRLYNEQVAYLSEPSKNKLREAQRTWLLFRDKDCEYQNYNMYGSNSAYNTVLDYGCLAEQTKTRITKLNKYVNCRDSNCPR